MAARISKKRIAEEHMENGYLQCVSCRGYGPAEEYSWHKHRKYRENGWYGEVFQYCSDECRQKDGAEPEKEE